MLTSRLQHWISQYNYNKQHKQYEQRALFLAHRLGINAAFDIEQAKFIKLWSQLDIPPCPNQYALYSHFINDRREYILSQEAANTINRILNPKRYSDAYGDKNTFDFIFPKNYLPKTFLRVMNGLLFSADYQRFAPPPVPPMQIRKWGGE